MHWRSSSEAWENTRLAVKKIVFRALLVRVLPPDFNPQPSQDGEPDERAPRLGRLHDSAYDNWQAFIRVAAVRYQLDTITTDGPQDEADLNGVGETVNEWTLQARQISLLHILRCVLGPVVESLILLDRYIFLRENLSTNEWVVDLVNLFDQATGSARNACLAARRK